MARLPPRLSLPQARGGSPLRGLLTGPRGDPCRGDECGVVTDGVFPLSQNLFSAFTITSVQEMSLGADLPLNAISRLVWTPTTGTGGAFLGVLGELSASPHPSPLLPGPAQPRPVPKLDPSQVTLQPMEIRTFLATVQYNVPGGGSAGL